MNKRGKTKKLFWKLYPTYLLISVISVVAVSWYASSSMREYFLKQTQTYLKTRGYLLEKQIKPHLFPLNTSFIDSICKRDGRLTDTRFTVILTNGEVVGDTQENPDNMDNHRNRPEVQQAIKEGLGSSFRYSRTLHQKMMYVVIPVKKGNEIIAFIRASLSISSIDETLCHIYRSIAWGGLFIALFAAALSYLASRYVSRPIEEIRNGAKRFTEGDLKYRLPSIETEELESLSTSLNHMAGQLEEKIENSNRQQNQLQAVLTSMVEGVVAVDKEERIISVNQAAAKIFESSTEELQGRLIQEVIRNRDLQGFVKKALLNEARVEQDIFFYKNGERIINAYCNPLQDIDGKQIGTLVVVYDVTHLRRLENIRKDFVANVSHEIKTPLTAIKGFVETLQQGAFDNPEESRRFLQIISKHVKRLNSIVDDLLSLSRLEQKDKQLQLKLETIQIRHILISAIQLCQPKADDKHIIIDLDCKEELTAKLDPNLFEEVFVNLIDNAIKYSPEGKIVKITTEEKDSNIAIHFMDQGVGIDKQYLDRLFERFYRVDAARSRNLGGTGLGLAIVKHILQLHGGHIIVESTPGAGSTFSIFLPKT
ncbi:MAG: ATP-binding protein [Pseudomonadota bacterium]